MNKMSKPKPNDPIAEELPCECGGDACHMGLIIGKYPGNKIKIKIFDKNDIKTVVVNKEKLIKKIKELK